jgi:hypothetical protein
MIDGLIPITDEQAKLLHAAIGRARLVIAQVNPELPWTRGDTAIEPAAIDMLVPAAAPPIEVPARPAGPIDRAIADHVARLIPDRVGHRQISRVQHSIGRPPQETFPTSYHS